MTDLTSAPASRVGGARWLDGRVVLGVLLLLLSVLGGSLVVRGAQRTAPFLQVTSDLARGHVLTVADLRIADVRLLGTGPAYLGGAGLGDAVGRVLGRDVGQGELLPASALTRTQQTPLRRLSFAVPAAHAVAGDLAVGDRVDVLATVPTPAPARTQVLVEDVQIVEVGRDDGSLGGGAGVTVTVLLPPATVLAVVNALQVADLDVVAVEPGPDGQPGSLGGSGAAAPAASPVPAA